MRVGAFFLLLLPFAAPGVAAAQGISLPQALEAAFAHNPELAAAQWEIGVAEGDRQQAGLIPNPTVSWEVEDTRRNTSTTTVMLSQALELGGKRGARIEAAGKGQDAARLELERRGNELRAEVVQAFYAAARAQAGLELARQSRALAERGLRVAEGRVQAGKVSPVEATRAQVQLAETDLLVRRAETLKINSNRELARATGSPTASFERLDYTDLSPGKLPPTAKMLTALSQSAE
ncbi:TolC family protein, partial [Pseudomonas syringae]